MYVERAPVLYVSHFANQQTNQNIKKRNKIEKERETEWKKLATVKIEMI